MLRVEYMTDLSDPRSACWLFMPPAQNLDEAIVLAQAGLTTIGENFGASGFRILDRDGTVVAERGL